MKDETFQKLIDIALNMRAAEGALSEVIVYLQKSNTTLKELVLKEGENEKVV